MLLALAGSLPWVALLAFFVLCVRMPRALPAARARRPPRVSVVVPARNEAVNIRTCLGTLTASTYPDFEIVVVDDRSEDGTGELARGVAPGNARALRVLEGLSMPEGWMGKPWACAQGAEAADGELLLFTDADTVHGPELLTRAVAALEQDEADLLTLVGRQIMGTFWERLVQPQIFFVLVVRYFDLERAVRSGRWRSAIANGQFMLFRREAYGALGGHESVKGEVAEDLMLAQRVVREGYRLSMRTAEDAFATRMYRSLGELVAGWSKNMVTGGLATMPPRLRPLVAPAAALTAAGLWLAPPAALAAALTGAGGPGLLAWSAAAVGWSVLLWCLFTVRMGAPWAYGLLYPLGAVAGMGIFLRSWARGRRVEWKGRSYVVRDLSEVP